MADDRKDGLWRKLETTDRHFTKPIVGKSYRGDSPNPTYVIRKLTEQLGPIGHMWGFEVVKETVYNGKPHKFIIEERKEFGPDGTAILQHQVKYQLVFEQMHQVEINFWQIASEGEFPVIRSFSAFGGTPLLYLSKKGEWVHDEDAAKKSLTDAVTKAASALGACADIFLGVFDNKYAGKESEGFDDDPTPKDETAGVAPHESAPVKTPPKRKTSTPDGW